MKIKIYSIVFAIALIMTGCSKDFLDTEPTEFVSADQIEDATALNPDLQNGNIRGIYSTLIAMESGGTTGHDDFGDKGYDIFSDMLSGDMVLAGYGYGWYKDIVEYETTVNFTDTNNYQVWRFYYRIIFAANGIIDGFGGNEAVLEDAEARHIYGQAKAMRAFSYFYLANYFSKGYVPGEAILPIYTTLTDPAQPLSTGQEVYALIIDDLTQAIQLLDDFQRTAINQVNSDVAKGLLAYAYAAIAPADPANWTMVETLTSEIIGNYTLMSAKELVPLDYNGDGTVDFGPGGFNDVYTSDWMWGQDLTLDNGLDLVSWWGQIDLFTYSYAWAGDPKSINYELYLNIPANDIRKEQFKNVYGEPTQFYPINKFYYEEGRRTLTVGLQREVTTDYIYMRVEEFYLLNAEANAHIGDVPGAKASMKDLLDIRMTPFGGPTAASTYLAQFTTPEQMLDMIYLQTRIELWGEGKSYLAMKRNEATVTLGTNHLSYPGIQIPYNDDRMTFEIPEAEILNNPSL